MRSSLPGKPGELLSWRSTRAQGAAEVASGLSRAKQSHLHFLALLRPTRTLQVNYFGQSDHLDIDVFF